MSAANSGSPSGDVLHVFCERVCVFTAHRCESDCVLKNVCIFMLNRCVCEPVCIVCVCARVYKSAS